MADTKVKILDIQVRYKDAIDALAKYRQALDEAKKVQKDLKQELKDGKITQGEYDKAISASNIYIKEQGDNINTLSRHIHSQMAAQREQEGSVKQLRLSLASATQAYDSMSRAERESAKGQQLKNKINNITNELKGAEQETQRFYRNVGNYKEAGLGLDNIKEKAAGLGRQLALLVGISGTFNFAKDTVNIARDFEDGMARVRAVTNASAEDMATMTAEVRKMGRDTIYTASQAAGAMENLARGGLSAAEATTALSKTLMFAQANCISLEESSDLMIRALRGFSLEITDGNMNRAMDVLSKTAATSTTNVSELGEALKNAAPFGSSLKQPIEEVNAALGVLADVGIRGSDAGTALRMVIMGLASPTAKQAKTFEKYGIDITEASLRSEGLTKTMRKLVDSGIMQSSTAVADLGAIFGRRCAPQAMALLNNVDALEGKLSVLGVSTAAYNEQAKALSDSLNLNTNDTGAMLATLDDVGITGDKAGEAIKNASAALTAEAGKKNSVFSDLPIEINAATVKADGLTGTLQKLQQSGFLSTEKGAQLLTDLFGKELSPSILQTLTETDSLNQHMKDFAEADTAGTTARMFKQSYSEMTVALASLKSKWEDFMISLGTSNYNVLLSPIDGLSASIKFLSENIKAISILVVSAIAGISFSKLIAAGRSAATTIRTTTITNAEATTATVNTLQQQEVALRKTIAAQESALTTATGQERMMIEARVLQNKRTLATTEKALVKAKTAEIAAWERAAAFQTATGWRSAMTAATVAVKGFVLASKTAMKSFGITAIIMAVTEGIMLLVSWIGKLGDEGKTFSSVWRSITNAFKNFIQGSAFIQKALVAIKTAIAAVGFYIKTVWASIKFVGNGVIAILKGIASYWQGFGLLLKGVFTLNLGTMKKGLSDMGNAFVNLFKTIGKNSNSLYEEAKKNGEDVAKTYNKANAQANKNMSDAQKRRAKEAADEKKAEADRKKREADKKKKEEEKKKKESTKASPVELNFDDTAEEKKGGKGSDKEANLAKKRAELERKALEEAEKALLDLMLDTAAKRRAQVAKQYDDEIRKLRVQLATEQNLTETAREAINQTIIAKEKKKQEKLNKLSAEELKRDIEAQQALLESRIAIAQKGSIAELSAKREKIANKLLLDEQALEEERKIAAADAEERLSQAQASGGTEAVQAALERRLEIEADFQERLTNLKAAADQERITLEQQYQQQLNDIRQQAYTDQITQIENADNERTLHDTENIRAAAERELGADTVKVDAVTETEMKILEIRRDAEQQKLDDIITQGQLQGETEQEYNTRILNQEKAVADAKLNYRNAEVKNERAYLQSKRAITNSLVSLTSTIGESNETFAKLSKVITLAQIAIDTGRALSAGIASASTLPFPANLAAIATTIATILANVATAISTVKSAKFAEGGKVRGAGTGTSDSIPAQLSSGEFVMTARATRLFEPLLEAMNGIGRNIVPIQATSSYRDYNTPSVDIRESLRAAVTDLHPVVSVEEITEAQRRVRVIQNLDNI